MTAAISILATLITFVFAVGVLRQYRRRGGVHRLIWGVALLCYGVATGVQLIAEVRGWSTGAFRGWYLAGGLLTAAYLGQGTAFLLFPRRIAYTLLSLLVVVSIWGAFRITTVPLTAAQIHPPAGRISPNATRLPLDLRALAALLNIYGTLLLVGGAIWSAVVYVDRMLDRKRRAGYRLLSNLLIAGGSLIVAGAGSLETLGNGEYLYAAEVAGISIIYLGFLRSRETMPLPFGRRRRPIEASVPRTIPAVGDAPNDVSIRSLQRLSDRRTSPRR